jgi:hypothetical protein
MNTMQKRKQVAEHGIAAEFGQHPAKQGVNATAATNPKHPRDQRDQLPRHAAEEREQHRQPNHRDECPVEVRLHRSYFAAATMPL